MVMKGKRVMFGKHIKMTSLKQSKHVSVAGYATVETMLSDYQVSNVSAHKHGT